MSDSKAASTTVGLESVYTFCYLGDMLSAGGGVEEAVNCLVRCAWGKFNADLNNERDLRKGEGEDLQSLCAECDDVWQWNPGNEGWGHAEVEENWGEYDAADVWRLSNEASVKWSWGENWVLTVYRTLVRCEQA